MIRAPRSSSAVAAQHLDQLEKNFIGQWPGNIHGQAPAVVGTQVQAHSEAKNFHFTEVFVPGHHLRQVVIQEVRIVGQAGLRVHGAAVGHDNQYPALRVTGTTSITIRGIFSSSAWTL